MKFGLNAPNFGKTFGKPHLAVEMIEEAEKAGWDGFFLWDHLFPDDSAAIVDPFVALAAAAVKQKRYFWGQLLLLYLEGDLGSWQVNVLHLIICLTVELF